MRPHRLLMVAVAITMVAGAAAVGFTQQDKPRYGGVLNWFDYGDPARLDVHAESPLVVQQATAGIYSGLRQHHLHEGVAGAMIRTAAVSSCGVTLTEMHAKETGVPPSEALVAT